MGGTLFTTTPRPDGCVAGEAAQLVLQPSDGVRGAEPVDPLGRGGATRWAGEAGADAQRDRQWVLPVPGRPRNTQDVAGGTFAATLDGPAI
jgi:hypothetical protein